MGELFQPLREWPRDASAALAAKLAAEEEGSASDEEAGPILNPEPNLYPHPRPHPHPHPHPHLTLTLTLTPPSPSPSPSPSPQPQPHPTLSPTPTQAAPGARPSAASFLRGRSQGGHLERGLLRALRLCRGKPKDKDKDKDRTRARARRPTRRRSQAASAWAASSERRKTRLPGPPRLPRPLRRRRRARRSAASGHHRVPRGLWRWRRWRRWRRCRWRLGGLGDRERHLRVGNEERIARLLRGKMGGGHSEESLRRQLGRATALARDGRRGRG